MPLFQSRFSCLATENRTRHGPCSLPESPNHKVRKKSGVIEIDYANMSVEFHISMGRPTIVGHSTEALRKQALSILANNNVSANPLKNLIQGGWITKLRAKTIQRKSDSDKTIVEPVDFIKEQLTEDVDLGSMKDDEMTPEIILSGMMDAVGKFRKRADEYN